MELSICRKDAVEWLTDEHWIIFSFYSGFAHHLEHCYFTPGTAKNSEFEIMLAPVVVNGIYGMAPFCRIKDTTENRECLRAALSEFLGKRLLPMEQLNANIQDLRQKIKEKVIPTLR